MPRLRVAVGDAGVAAMSWLPPWYRVPTRWEDQVDAETASRRQQELDAHIERAQESLMPLVQQVEAERLRVEELETLLEQRRRLLNELTQMSLDVRDAQSEIRRAERAVKRQREIAAEPDVRGDRQRRGRAVKLMVDPDAFECFRTDARKRNLWTGWALRDLILAELDLATHEARQTLPEARRRRSPGEGDPSPAQRAIRVFIQEDRWPDFVLLARRNGLTVGRYLGQLVEAAAHENGWRAASQAVVT